MKARISLILLIVSSLLHLFLKGFGQAEPNSIEKLILCTDRNLYIAGEQINFSCTHIRLDKVLSNPSKILFVELMAMDGQRLVSQKHVLDGEGVAEGQVAIPSALGTGIYLLRAYTPNFKGFELNYFSYSLIKVINPQKPQLVLATEQNQDTAKLEHLNGKKLIAELVLDKTHLKSREKSIAIVRFAGSMDSLACVNASIVPSACIDAALFKPEFTKHLLPVSYRTYSEELTLTGQVLEEKTSAPMPNKRVNLSIIGSNDFVETTTDENGRFCFELPSLQGLHDVFINVNDTTTKRLLIQVDHDFAPSVSIKNPPPFNLSEEEANTAHKLMLNYLINMNLGLLPQQDTVSSIHKKQAFYGTPDQTLVLDDFIQLPTLEEYFNELPYLVKVRKERGRKYFKLYAPQKELELYEPLVLIDFVAINKPEKVLAIAPSEVQRIEFVHQLYQRGNGLYGGIVSIISKKGNFAGVDLPGNGLFLNFTFFTAKNLKKPIDLQQSNLPYARNTLLWEPKLKLTAYDECKLDFSCPDTPGEYTVFLNCVLKSGKVLNITKNFWVE